MAENITQEDLNAVRQQIRAHSALGKMEPILQKVLQAEEQALQFEKEKLAAIGERDRVLAEIKAERETHQAALKAEYDRQNAEFAEASALARKQLADELAAKEKEIAERRQTSQKIAEHIEELRKEEAALKVSVDQLAEMKVRHKKEIAAVLAKLGVFTASED